MINTVIVDDEKKGRDLLQILLREHCPFINVVGVADDISKALELINLLNPELIFLDIQMPGGSGFDLLEKLGERKINVIFVTAYHEHAIKAFKFSALDYLLKPIDEEELVKAVKKAEALIGKAPAPKEAEVLKANYNAGGNGRLALSTSQGLVFVEIKDIERCEASGKYTTCFLVNTKEIIVTKNLKEFEDVLSEYNFIRIHHSHLINLEYIQQYHKGRGGYITMKSGSSITVSQRKKDEFLKRLNKI
jgi:two-component system LytT family response regulator